MREQRARSARQGVLCIAEDNSHPKLFSESRSWTPFSNGLLDRRRSQEMDRELMTQGPMDPAGTAQAMEELFRAHRDELEGRIAKLVGSREIARDIVQDTFVKLYQSWPTGVQSPIAFLSAVAFARAIDFVRREARASARDARLDPPPDAPGPELTLFRAEARRYFRETLAGLKDAEREMLSLRLQGLSYAQIADRLGTTSHMVGKTIHHALQHCRQRLRDLEIHADDIHSSGFE
jgi:RNA polymerase sigma factor (sigma-70 family)